MTQNLLTHAVLALIVLVVAGGVRAAEVVAPARSFKYNEAISLDWYEANANCKYKRGIHDYFLVPPAIVAATDNKNDLTQSYKNTPFRLIVRDTSQTTAEKSVNRNFLMAKRCGDKPSWFVYDFATNKYLADDVRYRDAEAHWLMLGMPPIRLIKASRPGRHLQDLDKNARRLPNRVELRELAKLVLAPALVVITACFINANRLRRRRRQPASAGAD